VHANEVKKCENWSIFSKDIGLWTKYHKLVFWATLYHMAALFRFKNCNVM